MTRIQPERRRSMTRIRQVRAAWKQKYKSWHPFAAECEWCGDDFVYYAPFRADGTHDSLRYCSRPCITEARWEGKIRRPPRKLLEELYVLKSMSQPRIAALLGCTAHRVSEWLRYYGIPTRKHTSLRTCKVKGCARPAYKRFHARRDKAGCRILQGAYCREHTKDRWRYFYRKYKGNAGGMA
jgi:hypothetical protein